MTNETELRNRIADVIAGEEEHPHPRGYTAHAQAIIDEFWLEVVSGGGRPGQRQQIVGRWEKQ